MVSVFIFPDSISGANILSVSEVPVAALRDILCQLKNTIYARLNKDYGFMFIISVLAAMCSTTASIPQLLGKVTELSNKTMIIRFTGAVLWFVYGILISEYALIASSCIAAIIELFLFIKTNFHRVSTTNDKVQGPIGAEQGSSVSIDRAVSE